MPDAIPLDQDEVLWLLAKAIDQRQPIDGLKIVRQWMDGAADRIAELEAALAEQTKEIERLRGIIGNLVNAINELGNTLFGKPTYANPRSWRDAKAEWWQRCVKAVDAAEAAKEASDAS